MIEKKSSVCFAVSLGMLIVSIFLVSWGIPAIVSKQIQKRVQLDNSSMTFEKWRKMPMPMDFNIYVFNVTNPDHVTTGSRPKLNEIGPFVYKEYRERTIIGYGPNDTIRYMMKKTYIFDQEASGNLTEDDEVTVINFSYMAAILQANSMLPSLIPMINEALQQFFPSLDDAFLRVKARDLFFDGIYLNCAGNHSALGLICGRIKAETPATMRAADDGSDGFYFSMFSHLNRSESGPYEMVRGRENIQDLGHIVSYQNKSAMTAWDDQYCNMINGSDSSVFPPIGQSPPERLYTFEPDVCRSMYATLAGMRTIFNVSAYYYEITEDVLASKSANPNNRCFCKRNWSGNHDGCLLMGVMNLQPCQGAPAIASLPHFYLASEELLEYFSSGINPDKERHNTYVYIDPTTGVVLKGLKRLQFNIELRNLDVPQLAKVKTGVFPLLWIEEGAELPESVIEEVRSSHTLLGYVRSLPWVLVAVAVIFTIGSAVLLFRSGAVPWPRNNSVSFILRPSPQSNKAF